MMVLAVVLQTLKAGRMFTHLHLTTFVMATRILSY